MKLPSSGELVAGRFLLGEQIGAGGFATVMAATDTTSGERVAIKFLRLDLSGKHADTIARFEREVAILEQMRSPGIVKLVGHGTAADGISYAVFEHLDGVELAQMLNEEGRLSPGDVRAVLTQLLEALWDAHQAGVLHRDLKPENVIVTRREPVQVTLIDFGIARPLEAVGPQITATGDTIGTIRYMSPEQLKADPLTPASDIYSLGMVAVEMLLGRDGLQGGALHDQFERMRTGHVFSIPALEDMDLELQQVIAKMTARSRKHDSLLRTDLATPDPGVIDRMTRIRSEGAADESW